MSEHAYIVVAAHNESSVLGDVLDELLSLPDDLEIVVVDDGSTDATFGVASSRRVRVLQHVVNLGQGAALKTGIDHALACGAQVVVTFDGDGQMSATDVPALVRTVSSDGYDVALGTRFSSRRPEGMPFSRRALISVAVLFTRATARLPITDVHNGLRAFSRSALESMTLTQDRMAHASEMLSEIARLKLRWKEVPVHIRYTSYSRRKGQSMWGAIDIVLDLLWRRR